MDIINGWLFIFAISVMVSLIAFSTGTVVLKNRFHALLAALLILAVPFYFVPIPMKTKTINKEYTLNIPYTQNDYVKIEKNVSYGSVLRDKISFIDTNGIDKTIAVRSKPCKIKYKIGKKNKISYKEVTKRNLFNFKYYYEITNVTITKTA